MKAVWSCGGIRITVLIQAWLGEQCFINHSEWQAQCAGIIMFDIPLVMPVFSNGTDLTSWINSQINCLNLVHNSISPVTWLYSYEGSFGKTTVTQSQNHSSAWELASMCGVCVCVPPLKKKVSSVRKQCQGRIFLFPDQCFDAHSFSTYSSLTFHIMILPSVSLFTLRKQAVRAAALKYFTVSEGHMAVVTPLISLNVIQCRCEHFVK